MKWLCKIGFHKRSVIFDRCSADEWWSPAVIGYECKRCGKIAEVITDQFDGTDGA